MGSRVGKKRKLLQMITKMIFHIHTIYLLFCKSTTRY